ncbi:Cupin domain protein [Rhizobium sp. RU36D]|nr:Cupin domain protein [Rhizobium sp. RU36D]
MKSVVGMLGLFALSISSAQAQSQVVVTPVTKADVTVSGQPIALPTDNPEVTVSVYEIPPGAKLSQHRHQYPRYGYVLSGKLRVTNMDTGSVTDLGVGGFIVEALGQWHYGENPGTEALKLLVIDQAPKGVVNMEPKK